MKAAAFPVIKTIEDSGVAASSIPRALALAVLGLGRFSLDNAFGSEITGWWAAVSRSARS